MFTTRQLTVATASLTFALALPCAGSDALAGGKEAPKPVAVAVAANDEAPLDAAVAAEPAPDQPVADPPAAQADEQPAGNQAHLLADPKPLSEQVKKGLNWLASQQHPDGGWGQGEESSHMRGQKNFDASKDKPNVGDTCAASLTLLRSGSLPGSGTYDVNIRKAVDYVCKSIEEADADSLYITKVRNTRLQSKLGTYVDTFLAAQMLSEVKGKMTNKDANQRVDTCLDKVIKKIEKHQQDNGQFGGRGWAMALNDAIAGKALNQAAQAGADVQARTLEKARKNAQALAPATDSGKFGAGDGTAGIELYGAANAVGGTRETDTTYRQKIEQDRDEVRELLEKTVEEADQSDDKKAKEVSKKIKLALEKLDKAGADEDESKDIAKAVADVAFFAQESEEISLDKQQLANLEAFAQSNVRWADNKTNLKRAQAAIVTRLDDQRFVAGFGNNGGEEFLSYTRIGESLYLEGGQAWDTFDKKMTDNLNKVQNKDGSWSGHHCITGRTFCTATALSVLMTDRMHVPEELIEAAKALQDEADAAEVKAP